jgi:hypothetical protein
MGGLPGRAIKEFKFPFNYSEDLILSEMAMVVAHLPGEKFVRR